MGKDGTVAVFELKEEGSASKRSAKGQKDAQLQWAEDILVTKSNLEQKNSYMQELESKVADMQLQNEYQIRLKDMTYNEKIKEVTEKFTQELAQDKQRYEQLMDEKEDMKMDFDERLMQLDVKNKKELEELEKSGCFSFRFLRSNMFLHKCLTI